MTGLQPSSYAGSTHYCQPIQGLLHYCQSGIHATAPHTRKQPARWPIQARRHLQFFIIIRSKNPDRELLLVSPARNSVEITLNAEKEFHNLEVQPVFMRNIASETRETCADRDSPIVCGEREETATQE